MVETFECNQEIKLDSQIKKTHRASAKATQPMTSGTPRGWKLIKGREWRERGTEGGNHSLNTCPSHLAALPPGPFSYLVSQFPEFPNHYHDTLGSPNRTNSEVSGSPGLEAQLGWGSGGSESGPASPTGHRLQSSTQETWRKKTMPPSL